MFLSDGCKFLIVLRLLLLRFKSVEIIRLSSPLKERLYTRSNCDKKEANNESCESTDVEAPTLSFVLTYAFVINWVTDVVVEIDATSVIALQCFREQGTSSLHLS